MNSYDESTIPVLFKILEERKITAKQLSDATGIPRSSITSWRKGVRNPKLEAVQKISEYLDVPVSELKCVELNKKPEAVIIGKEILINPNSLEPTNPDPSAISNSDSYKELEDKIKLLNEIADNLKHMKVPELKKTAELIKLMKA